MQTFFPNFSTKPTILGEVRNLLHEFSVLEYYIIYWFLKDDYVIELIRIYNLNIRTVGRPKNSFDRRNNDPESHNITNFELKYTAQNFIGCVVISGNCSHPTYWKWNRKILINNNWGWCIMISFKNIKCKLRIRSSIWNAKLDLRKWKH